MSKYYDRSGQRAVRPLHGPNAHPYLVATRALEKALETAPEAKWEERLDLAVLQLAAEHGPRFAEIVDWAIRERALWRPHQASARKWACCKRGHSLLPGSPHLKVSRDGTRCCGTCWQERIAEGRRRRAG